jgi:hypothetical protein
LRAARSSARISCALIAAAWMVLAGAPAAHAVEAVNVRNDASAIDLTDAVEFRHTDGDRIQVSTAPGPDGIIRRIEVRAREAGSNWAVFALANDGDEQIDRLIVAPHYRMVGSGLIWPDLGQSRIVYITPSSGDPPERQENASADVYRITLDPGTVITFVAELRTDNLPQLYLWEPDAYKDKVNSLTLYQGIVIGIAGLLALFLTILFVVKGSVMFPAAAALGWAVLIYIGIDFGFGPRFSTCRRAPSASGAPRAKRSWPQRCSFSCSPISTSIAGMCATRISPSAGSRSWARWSQSPCFRRPSRRASRAYRCFSSPCSASRSSSIFRPTISTAP